MLTLTVQAQDNTEHLKFKGVPIDGTLQEYVQKMKDADFDFVNEEDGTAFLQGDFAAFKGCTIAVSTLKGKDLVNKITVIFTPNDTWSSLFGTYSNLKSMLTEKYGKPTNCVEKFQGLVKPTDDGERMYAVEFDKCIYNSIFSNDQGDILLQIDHNSVTSCFVTLAYFDKINSKIIKAKAIDDL